MFLGVTETSVEMYPSFTAPSKSALHQHLNRDVFVISSNSDSDGTLYFWLYFNMQSPCQTSQDWEATNYSDSMREMFISSQT